MHLAKILTLLPTLGLALVVPRKAAPPWPLTDPGGYTIEDFPFLDFTERTALDPYIHLGKPDFGYPRVFKCLPVRYLAPRRLLRHADNLIPVIV